MRSAPGVPVAQMSWKPCAADAAEAWVSNARGQSLSYIKPTCLRAMPAARPQPAQPLELCGSGATRQRRLAAEPQASKAQTQHTYGGKKRAGNIGVEVRKQGVVFVDCARMVLHRRHLRQPGCGDCLTHLLVPTTSHAPAIGLARTLPSDIDCAGFMHQRQPTTPGTSGSWLEEAHLPEQRGALHHCLTKHIRRCCRAAEERTLCIPFMHKMSLNLARSLASCIIKGNPTKR